MRTVLILAAVALAARDAHAIRGCTVGSGFSLAGAATVPPRPRITYFAPSGSETFTRGNAIATIDGAAVPVRVTWESMPPYAVATFAVDSDRTGALVVGWKADSYETVAHYTIAKRAPPAEAHGAWSHFRQEMRHSTSTDVREGLQIAVDVPATRFHARVRRDAASPWEDKAIVAEPIDGKSTARLGDWGCGLNYPVPSLAAGVDLELTAELADGTKLPVKGLPAHVALSPQPPPPLPPPTPRH